MNMAEAVLVAWEALIASKVRAFLTMLGVIIGVSAVILLVSIGDGAKRYVEEQFAELGSNVIILIPGRTQTHGAGPPMLHTINPITLRDVVEVRNHCPSVKQVAPIFVGTSTVKYRNRTRSVPVIGATEEFQAVRNLWVEVGSFLPGGDVFSEKRVVVLGRTVKSEIFGDDNPLGKMVSIGETKFRVVGVMRTKGRSLGMDLDDLVFVPVKASQKLFNVDGLMEVLCSTERHEDLARAQRQIREVMLRRHDGEEDFTVINQGDMLAILGNVLTGLTYALGGIAGISLLVGGIGIMNILLVSVGERTKEIGIRMAVGAKRRDILAQFLVESVVLSSLGGALGIALGGGGVALAKTLVPGMPVNLSAWTLGIAFGFSFLVGVFFGVYPAMKASRLNPIDALRYE